MLFLTCPSRNHTTRQTPLTLPRQKKICMRVKCAQNIIFCRILTGISLFFFSPQAPSRAWLCSTLRSLGAFGRSYCYYSRSYNSGNDNWRCLRRRLSPYDIFATHRLIKSRFVCPTRVGGV